MDSEVTLKKNHRESLQKLLAAEDNLRAMADAGGLDPANDFRRSDWRGVDFGTDDLSGFDFTEAQIAGADFSKITGWESLILDRVVGADDAIWPTIQTFDKYSPELPPTNLVRLQINKSIIYPDQLIKIRPGWMITRDINVVINGFNRDFYAHNIKSHSARRLFSITGIPDAWKKENSSIRKTCYVNKSISIQMIPPHWKSELTSIDFEPLTDQDIDRAFSGALLKFSSAVLTICLIEYNARSDLSRIPDDLHRDGSGFIDLPNQSSISAEIGIQSMAFVIPDAVDIFSKDHQLVNKIINRIRLDREILDRASMGKPISKRDAELLSSCLGELLANQPGETPYSRRPQVIPYFKNLGSGKGKRRRNANDN